MHLLDEHTLRRMKLVTENKGFFTLKVEDAMSKSLS